MELGTLPMVVSTTVKKWLMVLSAGAMLCATQTAVKIMGVDSKKAHVPPYWALDKAVALILNVEAVTVAMYGLQGPCSAALMAAGLAPTMETTTATTCRVAQPATAMACVPAITVGVMEVGPKKEYVINFHNKTATTICGFVYHV